MAALTVLSGPERRRRWATTDKLRIVEESLSCGTSVVGFARQHDIHPNQLHLWRRQARTGALAATSEGPQRFVPVTVASSVARAAGADMAAVEVVLRNGRVLRLSEHAVPERVALLADALEGCVR